MATDDQGRPPAGSFRELLSVAMPMVLSSGSLSLMHVLDRIFLTRYSEEALAAATPAGMLHWTLMSFSLGTLTYVNTFVAQYEGARRPDRVSAAVWQGLWLALISGGIFLAFIPAAPFIFRLGGHAPNVQKMEIEYFSVFCTAAVPMAVSTVMSTFYSGRGRTLIVMLVNFASVGINALLAYLLIFGYHGFPELGIRGAALASVAASVFSAAAFLLLTLRQGERATYRLWSHWRFDPELFGRLMRYGLPSGVHWAFDIAGFTLFIFFVGQIGTTELAATNLAFNLNSLVFIPMMGFGTAVMTLVGMRIGEQRPRLAIRTTRLAAALSGAWTLGFALVYLIFPGSILVFYRSEDNAAHFAAVAETVVGLLRFVALYSFFDSMAIVFGSAVRGAGDTRFPLVLSALSGWVLMVVPTYVVCKYYPAHSLTLSWAACSLNVIVVGIGLFLRFQTGLWMSMRVIEHPAQIEEQQPAEEAGVGA
jgi:multidrug resistance protein, MATE family